jgi:hypothetical protein
MKIAGSVKSPDAALRFTLPFDKLRAGYLPLMVSLSNHARLAGACPGENRGSFLRSRLRLKAFGTFLYELVKHEQGKHPRQGGEAGL